MSFSLLSKRVPSQLNSKDETVTEDERSNEGRSNLIASIKTLRLKMEMGITPLSQLKSNFRDEIYNYPFITDS